MDAKVKSMDVLSGVLSSILESSRINLADVALYRQVADGRGGNVALRYRDLALTYADLADLVSRLHELLRDKGMQRGDRIAFLLSDTPSYVVAFLGIVAAGGIAVPINPSLPVEDAAYLLDTVAPFLVLIGEEHEARFRSVLDRRHLVCGDLSTASCPLARTLADYSGAVDPVAASSGEIAYCLFSSGTTGKPKAIAHRHSDILYCARAYAGPVLEMSEVDTTMAISKATFGYALGGNLLFTFLAGGTSVLFPERSTSSLVLEQVERYRPTILLAQPRMISEFLGHAPSAETLSSLRLVASAGENLSRSLWERWRDKYGIPLLDGFGSTEVGHIFIGNRQDDINPESTGKLLEGYSSKIIDDEGNDVAPGAVGRLCVRGPSLFPFYWNNPEETRKAYDGEWHITKDLFYAKDGYLYAGGRFDDMIKTGCGEWIFPQEIENVLLKDEEVLECAVVGHTDSEGVIRLKALVVPQGQLRDPEQFRDRMIKLTQQKWDKLYHKHLHGVEFLSSLPRSSTGKLQRFKLASATLTEFSYDC